MNNNSSSSNPSLDVTIIQNNGLKQWCDIFNGLRSYRSCVNRLGQSGINNSYLASISYTWDNPKVKCEPELGISVGCTIRRSRFGAIVLAIADNSSAKYAGVIEGSVLMEINGVVVIMESFQSIYRRLEAFINIPISLRFIHEGRVYDAVFWEQDMGIVWCGASDLAQVESLVDNGLAIAAGVKAGDIIIGLDEMVTKEVNYAIVVERLRKVKDKSTFIEFTGPREVPSIPSSISTPLSLFIDTPIGKTDPGPCQLVIRHSTILRGVEEIGRAAGTKRPSQNDSSIDKFFFMQRWRPVDALFFVKSHSGNNTKLCRHSENILEHLSSNDLSAYMLQLTHLLREESLISQFFDSLSQPLYLTESDNSIDTTLFEVHMSGYSTPSTSGIMPSISNASLSSFTSTDQIPAYNKSYSLSSHLLESCCGNINTSNKLFWHLRSNIINSTNNVNDDIINSTSMRRSMSIDVLDTPTCNMFLDALLVMMSRLMKSQHSNWCDWRYQVLYSVFNGVSTNSMCWNSSLLDSIENIVSHNGIEIERKSRKSNDDINIRSLYETVLRYEACGQNKASFDGSVCHFPGSSTTSPSDNDHKNNKSYIEDRFGIFKGVLPWFTSIWSTENPNIGGSHNNTNDDNNNDMNDETYSETWRDCEGEQNSFSINYDDTDSITSSGSSRHNEYVTPKATESSRDSYEDSLGLDDTLLPLDNDLFFASMFSKQCALIDVIRAAVKSVHANITESQDNREERLRNTLTKLTVGRKNFWPIASPLHPNEVLLTGLDIPNCRLLKSSKYPAILAFTSVTNDDFEEIASLSSPRRKKYNISLQNLSISVDPGWDDLTILHCRCFFGTNVIRDILVSLNNGSNRLELLNKEEQIVLECVEEHPPTTFLILLSASSTFEEDSLLGECWISLLDVWSDLIATESANQASIQLELPVCPPHWISDSAMFHTDSLFVDKKDLSTVEDAELSRSYDSQHSNILSGVDRMSSPITVKSDGIMDVIITPLKSHVYGTICCTSVETTIKKAIIRKEIKSRSKISPYKMLYKREDDVRQDEFVLQLIKLMDSMLKRDGLDLKLCTYEVITVGQREGIIEWVNGAIPLSSIIQEYGANGERNPIQAFMRLKNFSPHDPYFINSNVMDTYLRSCAGYSVITYILGVGDRHLDNLLMKSSGEFMHVDFGYMFGRDPKPFKPQLRFTQEMLLAMGGEDSPLYEKFLEYCCLSYNIIRRSSVVLLSYLRLTCHVGISDLSVKQYPADAILAVSDRLHLELDDNRAFGHMRSVIADSQSAVMPVVMEQMHRIASVWR